MADEEKIVSLTYVVDPKSQVAINAVTAMNDKLTKSMQGVAQAAEASKGAFLSSSEPLTKQEALLKRVENGLNPLKRAYEDAASSLSRLQGIMNQDATTPQRIANIERARVSYEALKSKVDLLGKAFVSSAGEERFATVEHVKLANAANLLRDKIDPLGKIERDYAQALSETNRMLRAGVITQQEYNKAVSLPKEHFLGMSSGVKDLGLNTRIAQYAMTNFAFQINDVVSGLAMGQQPFRIFAQQAGQFVQIFQQLGREHIGEFFKNMGNSIINFGRDVGIWLISPIGRAVAAISILTAAFGTLLIRAVSISGQMRELNVALTAMHTSSLEIGVDFIKISRNLGELGISASDAQKALLTIIRTEGVNPAFAERIITIAENIKAAFGGDTQTRVQEFSRVIAGGINDIVNYGVATVKLDHIWANNIRELARVEGNVKAANKAISDIEEIISGKARDAMGGMERNLKSLGTAWGNMFDSLVVTSGAQKVLEWLEHVANVLERMSTGKSLFLNIPSFLGGGQIGLNEAGRKAIEDTTWQVQTSKSPDWTASVGKTRTLSSIAEISGADVGKLFPEFAKRLEIWISALDSADRDLLKIGKNSAFATTGHTKDSLHYLGMAIDIGGITKKAADLLEKSGLKQNVAGDWPHIEMAEIPSASVASKESRVKAAEQIVSVTGFTTGMTEKSKKDLGDLIELQNNLTEAQKKFGPPGIWWKTYYAAIGEGIPTEEKKFEAMAKANQALEENNINISKALIVESKRTEGVKRTSEAYDENIGKGIERKALEEALIKVFMQGGDIETEKNAILAAGGAQAVLSAKETLAAMNPQIEAEKRLAIASKESTAAKHDMEIQNQAIRNSQDVLNQLGIKAAGITEKLAKEIIETNKARLIERDILNQTIEINDRINARKNQGQSLQLEISLQGKTTEEINKQVAILNEIQILRDRGVKSSSEEWQNAIKSVTALEDQKIALTNVQREWKRLEDSVKSIADSITGSLTRAIEDAFNGKKITDWGSVVRSTLSSILTKIIDLTLIKPATGSVLSALGFTGLAKSFGTFSDLFSTSNTVAGSNVETITSGGGDISGLNTVSSVASLGSSVTGLATGSTSSFLSSLGLGSTLATAIPYVGVGLGALSLIGSATGLFDDLFGSSKPKNKFAQSSVSLGTGKTSGFTGSGANASTAKDIATELGDFAKDLIDATGGTISGGERIDINVGTNTGIQAIDKFGTMKFATAQEAVEKIELLMIQRLDGVSETMKTVLGQTEDLDKITENIEFAMKYDDLAEAVSSAFTSISTDTEKIGPFETALEEIGDIFDDLTDSANEFGLSLDPINEGLKEATDRLIKDWDEFVQDQITAIEDPIQSIVDIEKEAGDARVKEAETIGASLVEVNRLNALELEDIWEDQTLTLKEFADSLRTGTSSGLNISDQISAANDNFLADLKLVQGGSLTAIADLATSAKDLFGLSEEAYGNAPKTATIRSDILTAVDDVLANRSFASGSDSTPEGWIRVGENGPEWMKQSGGNTILPSGTNPSSSNSELINELKAVRSLLESGNTIVRGVGIETINKLQKMAEGLDKKSLQEPQRQKVA